MLTLLLGTLQALNHAGPHPTQLGVLLPAHKDYGWRNLGDLLGRRKEGMAHANSVSRILVSICITSMLPLSSHGKSMKQQQKQKVLAVLGVVWEHLQTPYYYLFLRLYTLPFFETKD